MSITPISHLCYPALSSPQARELKSVYLRARGSFMKFLIHKCYINPSNLFNQVRQWYAVGGLPWRASLGMRARLHSHSQVGLIAINVLGSPAGGGVGPTGSPTAPVSSAVVGSAHRAVSGGVAAAPTALAG